MIVLQHNIYSTYIRYNAMPIFIQTKFNKDKNFHRFALLERERGSEREREIERKIYIYIYIQRERQREIKREIERERERERERESENLLYKVT